MLNKLNYQFFSLFDIGKLPASGTFGSLFTVIFYYAIQSYINTFVHVLIIVFTTFYSLYFLKETLKSFKSKDPKEIVIDEFIGQLIPLIICGDDLVLIFFSFIIFRIFDITKIFPANIFDKKIKGSLGILGDDIIAGIYSLVVVYFLKINLWKIKK